ncbi:alkaline phosphatase, partial [Mytilus galloprovincialis]
MFPFLLISLLSVTFGNPVTKTVEDANYWRNQAQDDLNQRLSYLRNTNAAKNVIMFLGDGMGISTVTAARIYKGQLNGQTGEEAEMTFEKFPYTGFIKTYNTDQQVPDSAGTATAFLCGVKSKAGTVGVDDKVQYSNCSTVQGAEVTSILDWSLAEGKSVGLVTTTRVTHATPAAAYAHAPRRSWEGDTNLDSSQKGCTDIAYQLIKDNPDIQVILGGGRRFFLSKNETDPERGDVSSYQRWDTSLVQEWIQDKQYRNKTHAYAWRKKEFDAINPDNTDFVLGLFWVKMLSDSDKEKKKYIETIKIGWIKRLNAKQFLNWTKNNKNHLLEKLEIWANENHHIPPFQSKFLMEFAKRIDIGRQTSDFKQFLILIYVLHDQPFQLELLTELSSSEVLVRFLIYPSLSKERSFYMDFHQQSVAGENASKIYSSSFLNNSFKRHLYTIRTSSSIKPFENESAVIYSRIKESLISRGTFDKTFNSSFQNFKSWLDAYS